MCDSTPRQERDLPVSNNAPAQAREFLRAATCGVHAAQVLDDAVLLVSELVTNSVVHGGPPIVVAVECVGGGLQVQVRDGAPGLPEPRTATGDDENGRGLALVDLVSTEWGVDPVPDGKHVWFRLR